MKKTIISILVATSIMLGVGTMVMAVDPETETTASVETQAEETVAETVPSETVAETTAAETVPEETTAETIPEVTEDTTPETEATSEEETQTEATTEETTAETTAATETSAKANDDINVYKVKKDSDKVQAKTETKKDQSARIAVSFMLIGMALGIAGGTFLGWFLHKRKQKNQHDMLYTAIKEGELHEALNQTKADKAEAKKQEQAQKKAEAQRKAELSKAEKTAKKEEAKKQKQLAKYKQMQQELGLAPVENEPQIEVAPKEPKPTMLDRAINVLEKQRDKRNGVEAVAPAQVAEPQQYVETQQAVTPVQQQVAEPQIVDQTSMLQKLPIPRESLVYGGEWNGAPYYFDARDPKALPFQIVDGKKVQILEYGGEWNGITYYYDISDADSFAFIIENGKIKKCSDD